ncbi:helix-turn-helix domain-containing protein [Streptomyces sp. WMMC500]|uniref:PucR family transcriptional regulator n=1 Tax=Streptomyces sp. WMMC500 TaxID=3015154 RepID=UPI00248BD695|nr:PucR family transcriptional regulator [Streptomyces sp. WMMC500]WBB58760.1 helix-turn-helix domain-containing protein [Streptomyces sp. WMMC500]
MPDAGPAAGLVEPPEPLPPEFAAIMRPELPSLVEEIAQEIRRGIPEYDQLLEGPYGEVLHQGVEQNLSAFVEQVANPKTPTARRDEMCRRLGRFEAYEGRSFQYLRSALRIGARVALRRAKTVGARYTISPTLMAMFADAVFAHIDAIEELCREGYREAQSGPEDAEARRRRLLRLLLAGGTLLPAHPAVTELAEEAAWPLPEVATPVALAADRRPEAGALDADVLGELADPQPHLLVPGPLTAERRAMLAASLAGCRAAIGVTVPLARSADSLRWARQALGHAETGIVRDDPVFACDDHMLTLWLMADPPLAEELARRQLAPLAGHTQVRRDRLVDTLRVWLTTRGTAARMARMLHVHPQTVRYRLRRLHQLFGMQLDDHDVRFAVEVAVRTLHLRQRDDDG